MINIEHMINNLQEEQLQFTSYLDHGERFEQIWDNKNHGKVSDAEITDKYFQILSDSDIEGLLKIYKLDFQLFNYTFSYRNRTFIQTDKKSSINQIDCFT